MNKNFQTALADTLDFLFTLQRDCIQPNEARDCLQALRKRHPELAVNLLSEVEAYDQSVHYDVLLQDSGDGTISLSYCPERATPWPLRGVHRWNDADLLRVNAYVLRVDEAIAFLDFVWDEARITEQLVNQCVMREELARQPIVLTDVEVQQALDQFRASRKLFMADDMFRWLAQHGMTHESLERYVSDNCLIDKLRDRIAEGRVNEYFRQHCSDFDTVRVARIEVAEENQARELAEQVNNGSQDFWTVAEYCFHQAADGNADSLMDLFAVIERRDTTPETRDLLFDAAPGQMVGPVASERGYRLFQVLAMNSAVLDDRIRYAIKNILFEDWLAERRKSAQIEWCWGNASRTG